MHPMLTQPLNMLKPIGGFIFPQPDLYILFKSRKQSYPHYMAYIAIKPMTLFGLLTWRLSSENDIGVSFADIVYLALVHE